MKENIIDTNIFTRIEHKILVLYHVLDYFSKLGIPSSGASKNKHVNTGSQIFEKSLIILAPNNWGPK